VEFLIVLGVVAIVVLVVSAPLRKPTPAATLPEAPAPDSSDLAELQAARDAKYREIRDAELDHRTGKLSDADYEAVDQTLRAEAVEILKAIDRASERLPSGTR
jgi:hypothetical protein